MKLITDETYVVGEVVTIDGCKFVVIKIVKDACQLAKLVDKTSEPVYPYRIEYIPNPVDTTPRITWTTGMSSDIDLSAEH
jgi:hypothetical protein